ncbi:MAG: hypothetical protein CMM87_00055 [Rickettsiales bacterium]|nr:hypothetical protein [Rickettsiales bacterium]|tara:strand:- start:7104 stop:9749 length:2646 start_codon:yes stop_codon:yes gene_type:complete
MLLIKTRWEFTGYSLKVIVGLIIGLVSSLFTNLAHPGEAFQDWQWDEKQKRFGVVLETRDGLESTSLREAKLYLPKKTLPPGSVRLHLRPCQSALQFNVDTFPEVIKEVLSTARLTFNQFLYKIGEEEPCYLPADPVLRQMSFGVIARGLTLEMNEIGSTVFIKKISLRIDSETDLEEKVQRYFEPYTGQDRIEPHPAKTMIDFFQKPPPCFDFNFMDLLPAFGAVDLVKELVVFSKEQLPLIEKSAVEESGNPILLAKEFYYIPSHIYAQQNLKIGIRPLPQDLKQRAVGRDRRKGFFDLGFYRRQVEPGEDFVMSGFSDRFIYYEFSVSLNEELAPYSTDFDPKHLYKDKGRAATSADDDRCSVMSSLTSISEWSVVSSAFRSEKSMTASSRSRFQGAGFPVGQLLSLSSKENAEQETQLYRQPLAEDNESIYMLHGDEAVLEDVLFLYSDGLYLYLTKTLSRQALSFSSVTEAAATKEALEKLEASLGDEAFKKAVKEVLSTHYPTKAKRRSKFFYTRYFKDFPLGFFSKDARFLERSPDGKLQYRFSLPMGGYAAFMDKTGSENELRLVPLSNNYKYEKKFKHERPYYPLHQLNPQQAFLYDEQYHTNYKVFLKTKSLLELLKKYDAEFCEIYDRYRDFWPFLTASISLENKDTLDLEHSFFEKKPDLRGLMKELSEGKTTGFNLLGNYKKLTNDGDLDAFPYLLKLYTTSSDESLKPAEELLASFPTSIWEFHKGSFTSSIVDLQMDNYNYLNYIPLFSAHDLTLRVQFRLVHTWEALKSFIRLARPGWYSQFSLYWYLEENEALKKMLEAHKSDPQAFMKHFFKRDDFFESAAKDLSSLNQGYKVFVCATIFNDANRGPLNNILKKYDVHSITFQ